MRVCVLRVCVCVCVHVEKLQIVLKEATAKLDGDLSAVKVQIRAETKV